MPIICCYGKPKVTECGVSNNFVPTLEIEALQQVNIPPSTSSVAASAADGGHRKYRPHPATTVTVATKTWKRSSSRCRGVRSRRTRFRANDENAAAASFRSGISRDTIHRTPTVRVRQRGTKAGDSSPESSLRRRPGIRPPNCGKVSPDSFSQALRCQSGHHALKRVATDRQPTRWRKSVNQNKLGFRHQ